MGKAIGNERCPACGWVGEPWAVTISRTLGEAEHNHEEVAAAFTRSAVGPLCSSCDARAIEE